MGEEAIRNFIVSKLAWIKKHKSKFHLEEKSPEKEYLSGESHYLFGERYLLNLVEISGKQYVELKDNKEIYLYMRAKTTKDKREKLMLEWYRENLKNMIPNYIEKWEPIIGVKIQEWRIKKMKTRWGSCNIQAKRIWLNLELAKKSPICLEYVVVHEMVHLLERTHNRRFKTYMDNFFPDWRNIKAELNGLLL